MSTRLQVLIEDDELAEIRQSARRERMTVSEWVRRSLREARRKPRASDLEAKLAAIDRAMSYDFPTADIEQMLAEIERGYLHEQ